MSSGEHTTSIPPISDLYPIRPVDLVLGHLDRVRKSGQGWVARCPAHEDRHPSLSVTEREDGSVRLKCFTGCDWLDIASAIGLRGSDLYPDPRTGYVRQDRGSGRITFARPDNLEGDMEDYAARMWEQEHGSAWKEKMGAAASRIEGMLNVRRRYGHKF